MNDLSLLLGVISTVFGLLTGLAGFFFWYQSGVKKRYAAERDFAHLKRNYEGLSSALANIDKELDRRFDQIERELTEIKALSQIQLSRNGGSQSGILGHRDG